MFKLVRYAKYLNPHDNYDLLVGQKQMEADIEKKYQLGLKSYGITSTEHVWEVLYGPKE